MPRIAGVDIPENKKIRYSLRYIYGIGPRFAHDILAEAGVDPEKRAKDLTDQEVSQIAGLIEADAAAGNPLTAAAIDAHINTPAGVTGAGLAVHADRGLRHGEYQRSNGAN